MTLCAFVTQCHRHYVAASDFTRNISQIKTFLNQQTQLMMKISRDLQDLTLNVKNLANIIKDLQEEKDQAQQYYGPRPEDDEENWDWPH